MLVPDIRGESARDAQKRLAQAGLVFEASEDTCAALPATPKEGKLKKDAIACQLPEPGSRVAAGTRVVSILASDNKP